MSTFWRVFFIPIMLVVVFCDPMNRNIVIDGRFEDWSNVRSYGDPKDNVEGTVYQESPWFPSIKIPDCHDTDSTEPSGLPSHVYNPNIDIVEVKIAHDDIALYVYYRIADEGVIGKTSMGPTQFDSNNPSRPSAGRYYVIGTVNIDMDDKTGYWLNGGGYYPTAPGFDGNFEIEFFNGTFNQNYYLDHAANNGSETNYLKDQNKQNQFIFLPADYWYYSQYVYWKSDPSQDESKRCLDGPHQLPYPYSRNYICFTKDYAPGPFNGIITYSRSGKGNELEMRVPFEGFLLNKNTGLPTLQLGMTINISLSLETTAQYSTPQVWCSDTAPTIQYVLSSDAKRLSFYRSLLLVVIFAILPFD